MPSKRIAPAADALIETLHEEVEVLEALAALYEQQLDAIRANDPAPMDARTTKIQDFAATLDNLSQKSERQARLLGRVLEGTPDEPSLEAVVRTLRDGAAAELGERLAEVQTAVAERVQAVNQRRETLRLALEYAADLNHELLVAMQEAASETDGQTYTANGQSESGSPDRSFVNAVG
jgi:flagellar biosynthesis/type III secretory pathway chaperone